MVNLAARISSIPDKFLVNPAVSILLISFLLMISGCGYYKVVTRENKMPSTVIQKIIQEMYPKNIYPRDQYPESNLEKMLWTEHEFYIIDSQGQWSLKGTMTKNDTMYAQAVNDPLPGEDNPDARDYMGDKKLERSKEKEIINRVKLYVDTLHFLSGDTVMVPFSGIQKYDIYKHARNREVGLALAIAGGVAVITLIIVIANAIANYEPPDSGMTSCPYIFTYSEDSCRFEGELFGGAIFRSLERDDYLKLNSDNTSPGSEYKLKMVNLLQEVQYINQAELILVNHDSNVSVLMDKYGDVQTVSHAEKPLSAYDSQGRDVLELISETDQKTYDFNEDPDTTISCMNHIDLVFTNSSIPDHCKILVKGHNTLWIDLLARGLMERLGQNYGYWVRMMDRKSTVKQKEWVLSQGLPLQVCILKGEEWQPVDYFDIVGPVAARQMVLPLDVKDAWSEDLTGIEPEYKLHIRLVSGYYFWELDYAALDFTENSRVEKIVVQPKSVLEKSNNEVSDLLADDDHRYLIQKEFGDEAIMNFILPENSGPSASIFLHSKGYYHAVIDKDGKSELAFIWSFLKPGRLSEYSYENYYNLRELLSKKE